MYRLYSIEVQKCVRRIEFKFIFLILLLITIGAHVIQCLEFYGSNFNNLRPAKDMNFLVGNYVASYFSTLLVLTPLLSSFIYSDNFLTDRIRGILPLLSTRMKYTRIIGAKASAVFTIAFVSFFTVLMLNIFLTFLAFPSEGGDDMFALPAYDIGIQRFDATYAFDFLALNSPISYSVLHIILISFFAGVVALFSFAVMTLVTKNRYIIIIGIFVFLIVLNLLFAFVGFFNLGWSEAFSPNNIGSEWIPFVWIIVLLISSLLIMIISSRKGEVMD